MTTTLNFVTIPDPYDYQAELQAFASLQRSANGNVLIDYFSTTPKNRISMKWRTLTNSERNTLMTALFGAISTSRQLVIPDSRVFTVVLDVEKAVTETFVRDATGYKYNISASFVEV